ncbi:MAG TPA: PASTA domain-containing protein, partial [Microthrixaceae bacterium]|nr:PASTA domain-containing protein [Microthrixaceae bacterium]
PKESTVDLVISQGPAPRVVPSGLVGSSAEKARAALEAVQLKAVITKAYDEKVAAGVIVSSSTETGASLERGAEVALVVSDGPAPIAIPDVRWVSGLVASQRLEEAGFTVDGIEGPPSGMVLQTDPTPGEKRQRGTAVRIFTKK